MTGKFAKACSVVGLGLAQGAPLLGERDFAAYSYEHFEQEFGRNHVGDERTKRKEVFESNLAMIRQHNSDPDKTWFATVNDFTDMTNEEFRARRGYKPHQTSGLAATKQLGSQVSIGDLPDTVDWRTKPGVLSDPKNQGACGGCWAFSAVESLEAHLAIATGKPSPKLSTQQVISCAPNPNQCGGTGGCSGSTQPLGFNYTKTAGITTDAEYPFRQSTGTCDSSKIKVVAKNSDFVVLPTNNYTALMNAVATIGPVSISVAAGGMGWQMYGGGIMKKGPFNKGFDIDHAVQLVGYGEEEGIMYWIVRNSWGSWGEKGYIRLQRFGEGKEPCGMDTTPQDGMACKGDTKSVQYCGLCGILSDSSYPTGVTAVGDNEVVV